MTTPSLRHTALSALTVFSFAILTPSAGAQDAADAQALRELIEKQQAQIAAQQAQLEAQSKVLRDLQQQTKALVTKVNKNEQSVAAVKKSAPPADPNAIQVIRRGSGDRPSVSTIKEGQLLDAANFSYEPESATDRGLSGRSRHDLATPTGTTVSYSDAAVVLRDPVTGTELGIHGFAMFQAMHDSNGLDNNEFDTYDIPVGGAPSQTKYSVNPSRLGFDSKTPLGWGRLNTLVSLDLNGSLNEPDWRLREAYGEIINDEKDFSILFGQTFSTALDLRSVPETLDFAGPTGYFARRQPLLRFSKLYNHNALLDIGLDTPENATYFDADTRTGWPDLVTALTLDFDGGDYFSHLRVMGFVRDLQATDAMTGAQDSSVGWAVGASGRVNLPFLHERDNFKFGTQYGDGYGATLKSGPFDAAFSPSGSLDTIGVFSAYAGLQHWWADKWRSNVVGGYVNASNPGYLDPDRLEETGYLAANLVWNPLDHVTIGLEYLYGRRENIDGDSGNSSRVLFSTKFEF